MKISDIEDVKARSVLKKVKINMMITKLLVVVAGALAIWRIVAGKSPMAIFWIFAAFAFLSFIWMQYFTTRRIEKLEKISISAVRECYEYYYQKAKTQRRKNMFLLVNSKCSLILNDYEKSLRTLELVQKEQLPLNYLGSYYMQLAIVKRLLGDEEGYQQNYLAYQNVVNEKSPDVERRIRLLGSENPNDALQLISIRESLRKNRKTLGWILNFAVFLFVAVIYSQGTHLLPIGYEYREWLDILGYYGVLVGAFFYATLIIVKLYLLMNRNSSQMTVRIVSTIVLVVCIILELIMLLLFVFSDMISFKAESSQADGTLYIREQNFLDPEIHYVCAKKGPLFRKRLYYEEDGDGGAKIDSDKDNHAVEKGKVEGNLNSEDKKTLDDKNDIDSNNNSDDKKSLADLQLSRDEERIANDYEAIYNYDYKETGSAPQYQYSAKGELYAVLGEYAYTGSSYAGKAVKAQKRLVFDRDSANKKYDLVVCYEDYFDATGNKLEDSSIVEFYAVSKDDQTVIAADKHAWADPGSKEYQNATGE